ncbi:unnamed protein product [Ambrosiozyma monospora]|uniref:General transcription and DNA repair factor IIH subunit TFB2 n=1 Tax=Ambrosiozyma monospora TaxID=43982 RepID=A0A9W6Z2C3_AMBMO|nr:unnamed protein product [Ambrosiozyma monospora]
MVVVNNQIINYLQLPITCLHADNRYMVKMAEEKLAKSMEYETSIGNTAALARLKLEVLPPTVVDQIKLWQLELDGIQAFKGYLYTEFTNDMEFERFLNYGKLNSVLYCLGGYRTKRKFFVTSEGNQQLIEYAKRAPRRAGTPA